MPECSKCRMEFDTQGALRKLGTSLLGSSGIFDFIELNNHSRMHRKDKQDIRVSLSTTHYVIGGIALLLVAGVVLGNPFSGSGSTGAATNSNDITKTLDNSDDPVIGSADAPVTIAYWGDYKCPSCNRFEQTTFSQLMNNDIQDGTVKFVKKNFPFIGQDSVTAAVASQCVWQQTQDDDGEVYWDWHQTMYDNQGREHQQWATQSSILSMSQQVSGVDTAQLEQCMNTQRSAIQQDIQQDKGEGRQVGVRGTPSFVVYNSDSGEWTQISGPQPYSRFQAAINQVS